MNGLCHRCNVSNVAVHIVGGLAICKKCMEKRSR